MTIYAINATNASCILPALTVDCQYEVSLGHASAVIIRHISNAGPSGKRRCALRVVAANALGMPRLMPRSHLPTVTRRHRLVLLPINIILFDETERFYSITNIVSLILNA